jgi:PIN domain nuclease of toxin-antitoxin system
MLNNRLIGDVKNILGLAIVSAWEAIIKLDKHLGGRIPF